MHSITRTGSASSIATSSPKTSCCNTGTVADFGIGKAISDTPGDTLTQAGMSVGTPAYMSPEQAVGEDVDGRSDLYSLGCVLYEMLVGEPPFTGLSVQAVIAKRFVQTPADVTALREGVPRPVERALQAALQRTPMDRPETMSDLLAMLGETESVASTSTKTPPPQSIAVLPFANLSDDRENQYFGDGIAENVMGALSSEWWGTAPPAIALSTTYRRMSSASS